MSGNRVRVRIEGGEELLKKLERMAEAARGEALVQAAESGADAILQRANELAPGPHLVMESRPVGGSVEVRIGPDKEHWFYKFFESGAQPHEIDPKKAGALIFEGRNGLVMTKSVSHTGMRAQPFARPAMTERQGEAEARIREKLLGAVTDGN